LSIGTPALGGGIGRGAIDLPPVVPECQEKEDCAELVDHMEAWPDEPELTEEMDMRGRCAWVNGAEGGMKIDASTSATEFGRGRSPGALDVSVEDEDHGPEQSSASASGLDGADVGACVVVDGRGPVTATMDVGPVVEADGTCVGGGGGGH